MTSRSFENIPPVIEADSTLARAYLLMSKFKCENLPVASEGTFVGILSSKDMNELLEIYSPGKIHENPLTVAHYMRGPIKVVDSLAPLSDVIKAMIADRLYAVLVLMNGRLSGVVSRENLLAILANIALEKQHTIADMLNWFRAKIKDPLVNF